MDVARSKQGCLVSMIEFQRVLGLCFLPVLLAMTVLSSAAVAQEAVFSPDATATCVGDQGDESCIGLSADQCMEATVGGYSTVGMNACLEEERAWWDGQLNEVYQAILANSKARDTESSDPNMPSAEDTLRTMQRDWIAYRDSVCNFEILDWYGGTGAQAAWLGCQMRLTGEQTLYLQSWAYGG
jgi:uncharacterized protein YecT (DUF1311 family)